MKAISPIIAIIIILLITIAIAGAGYSYISAYWTGLLSKQIQVLDASCYPGNQGKIQIRNIGTSEINTSEIGTLNSQTGMDISRDVLWGTQVSDPNLVLELRFDEGSGTTAKDTSGNGNDGTLAGPPDWVDGRVGEALSFDGAVDYIALPNNEETKFGTGDFTINAWINLNGLGEAQRIVGGATNGATFYISPIGPDKLTLEEEGVLGTIQSSNAITSASQWYMVTVVRESGIVSFYIDGNDAGGGGSFSRDFTGDIDYVGKISTTYFNGIIDEVRIYNRALSEDEIKSLSSNSVMINQSQTAVLTHTCTGTCSYNLVLPSGAKETMLTC